jgi:copper chaperone NosL
MRNVVAPVLVVLVLAACASGPPPPVEIDTKNDTCSWCRMAISDRRFAAQVVARGEEPRLFDDIGCLRDWLRGGGQAASGAAAFVADHRTRAWVSTARAVYAEVPGLATPMASGLAAWADDVSRSSDPDATGGAPLTAGDVFGPNAPPGGGP